MTVRRYVSLYTVDRERKFMLFDGTREVNKIRFTIIREEERKNGDAVLCREIFNSMFIVSKVWPKSNRTITFARLTALK